MVKLIVKILLTFAFFAALVMLGGGRIGIIELAACTILPLAIVAFLVRGHFRGRDGAAGRG
ncbi:hypothetical protein [Streptomyces gardneri]|uniref:hypothetical protein n=1 Tax=Streptomyces gardneri TaxID=66892 RepID=UPI0036D14006